MARAPRRSLVSLVSLAALAAAALSFAPSPAASAEFSVTNNDDAGPGSLRQAFIDATGTPGNDVIVVQPGIGTITLLTGALTHVPAASADLEVQGNGVTINANGSGGMIINNTPNFALDRVTITGGTGAAVGIGGGAVFTAGNLVLTNSTLTGNNTTGTGGDGGGVVAEGNLTIINSTISGNAASNSGGGAASTGGNATVTSSTLSGNTAIDGSGGGININGNVSVTASTISGNTAGPSIHLGGGIAAGGNVTLTRSTVSGNLADGGSGGGIGSPSAVTATNSTISGNTAELNGGGIGASEVVTLVYATVVGNTSADGANVGSEAGLVSFGSVVALRQGGGASCSISGSPTSNGFNFSDDASCGFTGTGDRQNAGDPGLGALVNNGGPTQTRLPQTGSLLIDAIPVASCQADGASGITTDQRGVTRPQGPDCDVGAVEVEVAGPTAAPASPVQSVVRFTG
jgi:hypothetical protein